MDVLLNLHPDGVFLRREAIALGFDDYDLRAAVRSGQLTRVRHGAYTDARAWSSADEISRHRLRAHAVLRSHATPLALSHTSAAIEHGFVLFQPDLSRVHVTCLDRDLSRSTRDVVYHYGSSLPRIVDLNGVPVVSRLEAALETASLSTIEQGLVVLDAALALGDAPEDLERCRTARSRWPHSRRLQITTRLARPGAESIGESLARYLMWRAHVPEPVLQYEVRDNLGHFVGRTDFAWPRYGVLGEFDGMEKYGRFVRPGETPGEVIEREKRREDRLREATGWLMFRLTWADLFSQQTGARLHEQLRRGRALLG